MSELASHASLLSQICLCAVATATSDSHSVIQSEKRNCRFHVHETERMRELDGVPFATLWQRLLGYAVGGTSIRLETWSFWLCTTGLQPRRERPDTWKMVARTRAVPLMHPRMSAWQSIESALAYEAAVLECGLRFLQCFWSENRMCAQDRLAKTIVVDLRRPKSLG